MTMSNNNDKPTNLQRRRALRRGLTLSASLALTTLSLGAHAADAWPAKPLRIVVPFPPGGGTDIVARAVGQKLAERLKQAVVIDNKPGASTVIGTEAVTKAAPDGYTLLLSGSTTYTVTPALRTRISYDPVRDLTPLAIVARTPLVLVVPAQRPWKNVKDLVAAARAEPRSVRYATFGNGSAPHLSGELFALAAGVKLQDVPYKGSSQTAIALIGGEIEMGIDTVAAVAPHVRAGKLRALAVMGAQRASMLPGVPTIGEQQLPDASFDGWYALSGPAGLPAPIAQAITQATTAVMADTTLQEQLRTQGMEPVAIGPSEFRKTMETEIARFRALAHRAHIVMD